MALCFLSHPDVGGSLVVVLGVEGHGLPNQNLVVRSHGGLQEDVDRHLVCKPEQLQQHRLRSVQTQRERGCDQIPEGGGVRLNRK